MKLKNTNPRIDSVVTMALQKMRNEEGYNPALLPYPESVTTRACKKIAIVGKDLYEVLERTGVLYRDDEIKRAYNLTEFSGSFGMLINDRDFDVMQTAPQCTATAQIVSEIARQANIARKAIKYSAGKPATFESVLDSMDRIAEAIGPLADYRRFQMDVQLAADTILEHVGHAAQLFDATGKCKKQLLASQAARFSVVRGEGRIQTFEVIEDAKPAQIVRAVRNAGVFDFSVGSMPIHDPQFMDSLAEHLEQRRRNAMKLH
jgi:hypothetical protein